MGADILQMVDSLTLFFGHPSHKMLIVLPSETKLVHDGGFRHDRLAVPSRNDVAYPSSGSHVDHLFSHIVVKGGTIRLVHEVSGQERPAEINQIVESVQENVVALLHVAWAGSYIKIVQSL